MYATETVQIQMDRISTNLQECLLTQGHSIANEKNQLVMHVG